MSLSFSLLGPLEVSAGNEAVHIGGARQRIVLAVLVLELGRVVPLERLIDAVWDDRPPATARTQIQIAISDLRRRLAGRSKVEVIVTRSGGYALQAPDEAVDAARFRLLVAEGRDAARRRELPRAVATLRSALELWRGDAASGIDSRLVQAAAVRLNEERLAVAEECIGLELQLGRHHAVIGELQELIAAHPLREKLHAHLMLALYRSGRQAEALAAYRAARQLLVAEHGIDPGGELRGLEAAILSNDPGLELPVAAPEWIAPRQLPAPPPDFVGREESLAQMRKRLERAAAGGGDVQIVVISGPGGVGKTALAVQLGHQVRESFPDGQLFAHLRGSDRDPAHPADVLEQFLRALGVPPVMLPGDVEELAALFRSRLAAHRILLVLDDAADAEQVLPLIPGDPGCAVVVTSRHTLPGLHGAGRFPIGVFEPDTSMALLARVIGERRVRMEAAAAAALAESCGHLPLALRIAAAKLSVRHHWQIAQMVARLQDEQRRLDELTLGGVGVRASISLSYQSLDKQARRLLLLLGALGAADFAGWVAGPLLDADAAEAAEVLEELACSQLVEVSVGPHRQLRYRLHDLIRIFAQEVLASEIPAEDRAAAQHRLLRCWLFLAREAHRREHGGDFTVLSSRAEPWILPPASVDEAIADPIEWFRTEHGNLVRAVSLAARLGHDELCWELAMRAVTSFESGPDREAWRETHEVALAVVRRAGNRRGEAAIRYSRAALAIVEQRLPDAQGDLEQALAWFSRAGDVHGRGLALRHLAFVDRLQGRYDAALARYPAALRDLRAVGDHAGEVHVLSNLAQIHMDHDRHGEAERLLQEARLAGRRVRSRRVLAQVEYRLGQLYLGRGDLDRGEEAFTRVLRAATEIKDPVGEAYALLGIGSIRLARGQLPAAAAALRDARETMRRAGHALGLGRSLVGLAEVALRAGDHASAAGYLDEADALQARIGVSVWDAHARAVRERLRAAIAHR